MSDSIVLNKNARISVGDEVTVNFNNSQFTQCQTAIVHHIPGGEGDSWIFEDIGTRKVHYISEGCTVTKNLF